jgi:glycosyltransferase involved in cell wall biosynthesis
MRILALLTRFKHHRPDGGYKRLLQELERHHAAEIRSWGNDETDAGFPSGRLDRLQMSYKWVAEFRAARGVKGWRPDLVHIMYGEEYFRFSHRLFRGIPLVATFHHPADVLDRELKHGDHGGRVAKWTHALNRGRFAHLAAAIVTHPDQKAVLSAFMPAERIHVIPLGVDLPEPSAQPEREGCLTLGNWFRDWAMYEKVTQAMPETPFHLVNRNLPEDVRERLQGWPNVTYHPDVSDAELQRLIASSSVAFLPLQKLAGSNALLECLAGGLPVVMSDVNAGEWANAAPEAVRRFRADDAEEAVRRVREQLARTGLAQRALCVEIAKTYSWPQVAARTHELFESLL